MKPSAIPPRILLVEDNRFTAEILDIRLRMGEGYFVTVAKTLDDAFRHWEPRAFDAVVLDRHLGDADGLDLLRRIRTARSACVVLVYSADGSERERREAERAGADGFVRKGDDLIALLRTSLRGRQ